MYQDLPERLFNKEPNASISTSSVSILQDPPLAQQIVIIDFANRMLHLFKYFIHHYLRDFAPRLATTISILTMVFSNQRVVSFAKYKYTICVFYTISSLRKLVFYFSSCIFCKMCEAWRAFLRVRGVSWAFVRFKNAMERLWNAYTLETLNGLSANDPERVCKC